MMASEGAPTENTRPKRIKKIPLKLLDGAESSDEETEPTAAKQLKTSKTKSSTKVKSVRCKNNSAKLMAKKLLPGVKKKMNNIILDLSQDHTEYHDDEDETVIHMRDTVTAPLPLVIEHGSPAAERPSHVMTVDESQEDLCSKIQILENKIKGLEEDKDAKDRELSVLKEKLKFLEDKITQFLDERSNNQTENQSNNEKNSNKATMNLPAQDTNHCLRISPESSSCTPVVVNGNDKLYSFEILETYKNKAYKAQTLPAMVKNLAIGYLLPKRKKQQNQDLQQSTDLSESQDSTTSNTDLTPMNQEEINSTDSTKSTTDPPPSNQEAIDDKDKKAKPKTDKTTSEVVDVQKIARLAIRDIDLLTKLPLTRIMRLGESNTKEKKQFASTEKLYEYRKEHFTARLKLEDISKWITAAFKDFNHKNKLKELKMQKQDAKQMISNGDVSNSSIEELDSSTD